MRCFFLPRKNKCGIYWARRITPWMNTKTTSKMGFGSSGSSSWLAHVLFLAHWAGKCSPTQEVYFERFRLLCRRVGTFACNRDLRTRIPGRGARILRSHATRHNRSVWRIRRARYEQEQQEMVGINWQTFSISFSTHSATRKRSCFWSWWQVWASRDGTSADRKGGGAYRFYARLHRASAHQLREVTRWTHDN